MPYPYAFEPFCQRIVYLFSAFYIYDMQAGIRTDQQAALFRQQRISRRKLYPAGNSRIRKG